MAVILPSSQSAFVDASGKPTPQFYSFLNDLSSYFHVGSGAPTFIAPQGALYLRTDGSGVATGPTSAKAAPAASWAAVTTTS
jgi:hypothetical protein